MTEGMTPSDVALLSGNNDNSLNGGTGLIWLIAIMALFGRGGFGMGGGYPVAPGVSEGELASSQANQTMQLQLSNLATSQADSNYQTAQLINNLLASLTNQNNTNTINAIQGFNNLGLQITNQTNVLQQSIQALASQLTSCCCEIKTQMLNDRLEDAQAKIVTLQGQLDNRDQTQTILSQLGRFVTWAGSGTPATASTVAG